MLQQVLEAQARELQHARRLPRVEHVDDVDAEVALKARPTHDKALLRAAVAARELKEWNKAEGFVDKCLEAHPKHLEAKQMLLELMEMVEEERKTSRSKAGSARAKLMQQIEKDA